MPLDLTPYVSEDAGGNNFPLVAGGSAASLMVSANDFAGVQRVVNDLQTDIHDVTGIQPVVTTADAIPSTSGLVVLIGTMGRSPLIDGLISAGKLDPSPLQRGRRPQVGDMDYDGGRLTRQRRQERPGDRRQRPAWDHLWRVRSLAADRRFSLELLGRRAGRAARLALCPPRRPHARRAGRQVPGLLHQRREPQPRDLGTAILRRLQRVPRRLHRPVLREGVRGDAAAQGQLSVAGRVVPGLQFGRPDES